MKLGLRVFLGYFFALGLTAWLALDWIERELRPLVRQASEETLVETAYALAAAVQPALAQGGAPAPEQLQVLLALERTPVSAMIWGIRKQQLHLRVHLTDAHGVVVFDSGNEDVGKDFSHWNDIYLTLHGRYGVRTTRSDPQDDATSVMHVAAPVRQGERLLGVLSVAMPGASTQAYLQQAKQHLHVYGMLILLASLAIGALFTGWLVLSLRRISHYAEHAAERGTPLPQFARGTELEKLVQAIDTMRSELEGRHYLENYIHHLTHELKSPLSAIRASNELLGDDGMPAAQRERFVANVEQQCQRLQLLTDRLLQLIRVEQKRQLDAVAPVRLLPLLEQEVKALQPKGAIRGVAFAVHGDEGVTVAGDGWLLALAIRNLLDNALQFAAEDSLIGVSAVCAGDTVTLAIHNVGPQIPDYALSRLGERFYCLPHADGSQGTGLGLAFVREIAVLHGGSFVIGNVDDGVTCELRLPAV